MASNIDPTVPTAGSATTASVRDNFDAAKTEIEALQDKTENVTTITAYAATLLDDATAADARTTLELGTIATQAANSVSITGGSIIGITDLAVADGGTGASTAADARTNLGVVIGTDVQAYDAGLADIAGLATTDGNFIVGNGTNWVAESGSTARTSLGLGTIATQDADSVDIDGGAIDGATIGGTTPAAGAFTTLTATGQTSLGGPAGAEGLRVTQATDTVNFLQISGVTTGNAPEIIAAGADTNIPIIYAAKGAGLHSFRAGSSENFRVFAGTNRVNYVEAAGGTTGNGVTVSAQGANTNVDLRLFPKGTGLITFGTASAAAATPGNFSADRYLAIKDSSGTTYYLPLMATTW